METGSHPMGSKHRLSLRLLMWLVPLILCGLLAQVFLNSDPHRGKPAEIVYSEFEESLRTGDFDRADGLYKTYEKIADSSSHLPLILKARLMLARKQENDALAILEKVPESSPQAAMAHQMAGQVHLRAGRLVPAERHYKQAIAANSEIVTPRRELIYIYGIQLRRRELREVFAGLAQVAPMSFQNVFHWCLTRGNDWEPQEIIDDMTKFLAADPTDRWSRIALARSLARQSKLDEAWKALESLADDDPDAIALRAQISLDLGAPEQAAELLRKGPRDHFDLAVMRARSALAAGELSEALDQFGIAVKIDPDNRDAVVGMARTLAALGRSDEARRWQERSTNLDRLASLIQEAAKPNAPADPELPRRLAKGCESVGHLAEAKAWWGLIAARDPLDQEAQSALYRLGRAASQAP